MKKFDIQSIQVSMYPKKTDIHDIQVSTYPSIQKKSLSKISKYPDIKKKWYPLIPNYNSNILDYSLEFKSLATISSISQNYFLDFNKYL